jgi:ABC-type branched-subunit amino acid transport system permease subunit
MRVLEAVAGVAILFVVLLDAFEAIVLPRRATRRVRLARYYYRLTWLPWRTLSRVFRTPKRRETLLGYYGPFSVLGLLMVWALGLILAFTFLLLATGPPADALKGHFNFDSALYMSGTNFFTLGLDDVIPRTGWSRFLSVAEAGVGFAFLAALISYLPVIYQAFSRREVAVVLLDARAGSPPTAAELLRRHAHPQGPDALAQLFRDWEHAAADIIESHISYPVLLYYRSQHDNESWLSAITAILDSTALIISSATVPCTKQAQLTFAMARHTVADLAQIFRQRPRMPDDERLPASELRRMREMLLTAGFKLSVGPAEDQKLAKLREMYEPYVHALAQYLAITLPPWIHTQAVTDNWKTSAWGRISGALRDDPSAVGVDDHS